MGWEGKDWIELKKDRGKWQALVNSNKPSGSMK
jgi:hypothetical protein